MLDADTKRRIDTARDILVGKVPDPKSQVEQITIALIYKFMDDLDADSEELGGKRTFFVGEFAKYGWAKLMDMSVGGHEMLALYAEGVTRMTENQGIPSLFRDIFKNAFLPYRDPETLRQFLRLINEFTYDHSEDLGDAFEYLLSVLGSQGDAGQFRTPRHIIDFIVSILDPKKDEVVLDPACGTAGFLISAYKHILAANTDHDGHSTLTPDDRVRLADNFRGYDISPDMVRLSLVNMYLHDFADPHIHEYDTLTSEERWNEYAEVILANPPFMSPKGGIRPHNRFSVKSSRSEVLFVDYMAEHLTANGRAGIIVPEGIVFQSQNAHKRLRKMLVEDYLVAVVSLPAGVFKPYSGVKTSVLILDRALAKRTDRIAFFKAENDGFDLGDQRRPIDKDDLQQLRAQLGEYLCRLHKGQSWDDFRPPLGSIVNKSKVAADGEYNLSGERYRESDVRTTSFPVVMLREAAEIIAGQSPPGESYNDTGVGLPFYQGKADFGRTFIGEPVKWTTSPQRFAEPADILMSVRAPVGPVNLVSQRICIGRGLAAIRPTRDQLLTEYAFYVLRSLEAEITGSAGAAFASINKSAIGKLAIPLPPLEVQQEIVAEIEGYQRVIDGARAVVGNYRPFISVDPSWPLVELGSVCDINPPKSYVRHLPPDTVVSFVPMSTLSEYQMTFVPTEERTIAGLGTSYTYFADNDVLMAKVTPCFENGKAAVARGLTNGVGFGSSEYHVLRCKDEILPEIVYHSLMSPQFREPAIRNMTGTGGLQRIPRDFVASFHIPIPPMDAQLAIVAEIQAEQALVEGNRGLIQRMESKVEAAIARVWT